MASEKKQILTVKNIRNVNMENILQSMLQSRNVTRSILAKENQISLMTVKHIVDRLLETGIIVEKESVSGDVGRNPKTLEISERYGNIVCINLTSREEIRFLIYDIYRNLVTEQSMACREGQNYEEMLRILSGRIRRKLAQVRGVLVGVAVSVPGAYDESRDLVNYDLIPELKELHLRALFEKEFEIENIQIFHDVFAAARAEYDSLTPKPDSQFYFYCGYGVGGYFIYQDTAVAGSQRMAGEVGKMLVPADQDASGYRILEDVVSVSAVKRKMKEQGMEGNFAGLLDRYRAGDMQAEKLLRPVLDTVSLVLYNLLWIYNPSRIVVDSCKQEYAGLIAEYARCFMEERRNEAIPVWTEISCAESDEYHRMCGCFQMTRDVWIEEIASDV